MKKILVTGAAVRIAKATVKALAAAGLQVRGMDVRKPSYPLPDFFLGDLRNYADVTAASRGCQAVVHLGAVPGPIPPHHELLDVNIAGTFNILEAAVLVGMTHIVSTSSIRAAGLLCQSPMSVPALPYSEVMEAVPSDPYSISKLAGEVMCRGYYRRHPFMSIRCIRPGGVQTADIPAQFPFPDGMVHVDDVADACLKCLQSKPGFGVYHLTSRYSYSSDGKPLTVHEIDEQLKKAGVDPGIATQEFLAGEIGVYSIDAAWRDLVWKPQW